MKQNNVNLRKLTLFLFARKIRYVIIILGDNMNLDNIMLVRAMDRIPVSGMILPKAKGRDINSSGFEKYVAIINEIILSKLEEIKGRKFDLSNKDDLYQFESIIEYYYPNFDNYETLLHFTFNGLLDQDDSYRLALIDSIKEHQDNHFINVDNIGVTTRKTFKVSSDATIVIRDDYFKEMYPFAKEDLLKNYKVELFNGSLKKAVSDILSRYNYPVFDLIKNGDNVEVKANENKESLVSFQDAFAEMTYASRLSLQELMTTPETEMNERDLIAADILKKDESDRKKIQKYYRDKFYELLLNYATELGLYLTEEEINILFANNDQSDAVLKKIIDNLIFGFGTINIIKEIVDYYNDELSTKGLTSSEILELESAERHN